MTKQKNIIIMMLAFLMLLPVGSAAQEVVQKLDSLQILIGEQTKLHLKVTAAKGAKVVLPSFKPSQMLIPGIEVVEQSDADTAELDGGRLQISRDYTLTSFDEKVYAVPALQVKVNGKTCQGNPLALKVLTVPVDTVHPNQFYPPKDDYLSCLVVICVFPKCSCFIKGGPCLEFITHLDSSLTLRL